MLSSEYLKLTVQSVLNIPQIHFNLGVFEHILVAIPMDQNHSFPLYMLRFLMGMIDFGPNGQIRKMMKNA